MRLVTGCLLAAILSYGYRSAKADTIETFDLSGVAFSDGGTATGSFVLDIPAGNSASNFEAYVLSANITTTAGSLFGGTLYNGDTHFSGGGILINPTTGPHQTDFIDFANSNYTASLVLSFVSLSTLQPFALTPTSSYPGEAFQRSATQYEWRTIVSGSLVPVTGAPSCFLRGTHILTSKGEVLVEDLKPGDCVLTADNRRLLIKRIIAQAFEPSPEIMPVQISYGALNHHTPHRDLCVSPSHCLLLEGVLIPAIHIVNGRSITRGLPAGTDRIEYFHIELDTHEVIVAEGAPVETLLIEGMQRCAPYCAYHGKKSELKGALRRAASKLVDVRNPLQVAYDEIARRAFDNYPARL
jgi:Hint domain